MQEVKTFEYIGKYSNKDTKEKLNRFMFNVDNQAMTFYEESFDIIDDDVLFINTDVNADDGITFTIDTIPKSLEAKVFPWKHLVKLELVVLQS